MVRAVAADVGDAEIVREDKHDVRLARGVLRVGLCETLRARRDGEDQRCSECFYVHGCRVSSAINVGS